MKLIPLTHGLYVKVSDKDFARLSRFKWILSKPPGKFPGLGYAVRCLPGRNAPKVFMHREIAGNPKGKEVDHKDGDKLNNQRSNLRVCTRAENGRNLKRKKNNTSGYVGVSWNRDRKKWQGMIHPNGKAVYLGLFFTKKAAARAYNKAARKFFGRFAACNPV